MEGIPVSEVNDAIVNECRARTSGEVARTLKGMSTRDVADMLGKSTRQALRYKNGEVKNLPDDVEESVEGHSVAAVLRQASLIDVGDVQVESSKGPEGTRPVGQLVVDGQMRSALNDAADLYEGGLYDEAESAMSAAIIDGYARSRGGGTGLSSALSVTGFTRGFRVN